MVRPPTNLKITARKATVPKAEWPAFAVVVPVLNEADNVAPLIAEIGAVMAAYGTYEMVFVDDGSDDGTAKVLADQAKALDALRVIRHASRAGQSAAIATGVEAARAPIVVTLDGDGQNDPADIPTLINTYIEDDDRNSLLVTGERRERRDSLIKRVSSKVANGVRRALLGDKTPDTGCGHKVFQRQAFLDMPRFDHMHRFLPALMLRAGGRVVSVPVNHRPRAHGRTKYGLFDRLFVGIADLMGVMWLKRRAVRPELEGAAKVRRGGNGKDRAA